MPSAPVTNSEGGGSREDSGDETQLPCEPGDNMLASLFGTFAAFCVLVTCQTLAQDEQ